jgi:putative ABC transport system substrate-binding protein
VPRVTLVAVLVVGLLGWPPVGLTQQAGKVYRVGIVSSGGPDQEASLQSVLRERLRERGWVEGQNLAIEWRYARAQYERAAGLVDEMLRLKPDVLMTRGGPVTTAAKRATATIPIVMWGVTDPVGIGVVASLSRPGGNVTGLSDDPNPDTLGKRLHLLKEVVPALTKVAVLTRVPPSTIVPAITRYEEALQAGARSLGLHVKPWPLAGSDDVARTFGAIVGEGVQGILVLYAPVTWAHRREIIDRAARQRLPAMYSHRGYVLDGGLMAYGEDEREVPQRLAVYLDRILRGARPADLPVEQPAKLELVLNLRAARALGLVVPQSLLWQADHVIE